MAGERRIAVLGAGPTGLGAGHRLHELGYDDWVILEASDHVGGLASSFVDDRGYTYDFGVHVLFSHYPYWDKVVDALLGDDVNELTREAWVWMHNRFVRYPFQQHLASLDGDVVLECVLGVVECLRRASVAQALGVDMPPRNFAEWVRATFGDGIAKHFMLPYNEKVWATPPELMAHGWIGERVSPIDLETLLREVLVGELTPAWGPNQVFRYPRRGGTGHLFQALAAPFADHIHLQSPAVSVDPILKVVRTADGERWPYDELLSTIPLNRLMAITEGVPCRVASRARELMWSGTHIVAVAVDGQGRPDKTWIYFPEPDVPFYRVSYLSNCSPFMCPTPDETLLLTETSWSGHRSVPANGIVRQVVDGLRRTGLLEPSGRIVNTWARSAAMTYPVPSLRRDDLLASIHPWLASHSIRSRGRFGAWCYEIGNMDHSVMQGVEFVDAVLAGEPETVWRPPRQADVVLV
jgi:UDP-galactopyranose mutase